MSPVICKTFRSCDQDSREPIFEGALALFCNLLIIHDSYDNEYCGLLRYAVALREVIQPVHYPDLPRPRTLDKVWIRQFEQHNGIAQWQRGEHVCFEEPENQLINLRSSIEDQGFTMTLSWLDVRKLLDFSDEKDTRVTPEEALRVVLDAISAKSPHENDSAAQGPGGSGASSQYLEHTSSSSLQPTRMPLVSLISTRLRRVRAPFIRRRPQSWLATAWQGSYKLLEDHDTMS